MKTIILLLLFSLPALAENYPRTATGIEAGVVRLKNSRGEGPGTSWMFHFGYRPDRFIGFFGQAGQNTGEDKGKHIQQNVFAGGGEIALLPVLDLKLGFAQSVSGGKNELGPLAAVTASQRSGVWRPGVTVEVIRTPEVHSFSLRGILYFDL